MAGNRKEQKVLKEVSMKKQEFVLNELEAIAKDMEVLVSQERQLLEKIEQEEVSRPGFPSIEEGDTLIPGISWFQARLRATKDYLLSTDPDVLVVAK